LGRVLVSGTALDWELGDLLRLELYEGDLGAVPADVGLVGFALDPGLTVGQSALAAWQDRQGAVRLSVAGGTVLIDEIILEAYVPADALATRFNYYQTILTPVAEMDYVRLNVTRVGGAIRLEWSQGTLLEASEVNGPWSTNSATSPLIVNLDGPQKFYQVRVR
jgi:hypothetical protein